REVLRLFAAEFVDAPEDRANAIERRASVRRCAGRIAKQTETFLRERIEDVVLAREVAVDRGRAVFDALGNLANRNVLKALGHEQSARGVEHRAAHGYAVAFLAFFDPHLVCISGEGSAARTSGC